MPHIDNNVKLDFKDVLIRPKRSTIRSRADVDLSWKVVHRYSKKHFPDDVIPIIVSNMDTTGTFNMAKEIAKHKLLTSIHKHYTVEDWKGFAAENPDVIPYVIACCGMVEKDVEKIADILSAVPEIRAICLDVANGYSEHFVEFVKEIRAKFPEHIIIAGNVVTGEMVEQLILNGADVVKVGIGPDDCKELPREEKNKLASAAWLTKSTGEKDQYQKTADDMKLVKVNELSEEQKNKLIKRHRKKLLDEILILEDLGCEVATMLQDNSGEMYHLGTQHGTMFLASYPDIGVKFREYFCSVCTTRRQTGVGYPQVSAVLESADAAHGLKGHVISDGGCTCPGDIAKAFGAGADFVMLGGMFAGHDQSGGDLIERDGKKYKIFYGMSSCTAMKKHSGGIAEYRSSEGKTVEVPYRGDVKDTVLDMLGGLRSACTYVGAPRLKELSRRTTFIRVTQQSNNVFSK